MRMRPGNRGLTRAELGIRLCSSSCKGMAHQIPAAPLSSSSRTGGGTPSITGSHPRAPGRCCPRSPRAGRCSPGWVPPGPPTHQHPAEAPAQADVELLPVGQEDEVALGQLERGAQHRLVRGHGPELWAQPERGSGIGCLHHGQPRPRAPTHPQGHPAAAWWSGGSWWSWGSRDADSCGGRRARWRGMQHGEEGRGAGRDAWDTSRNTGDAGRDVTEQVLTLSVGTWEGGWPGRTRGARGALPPLVSNTRGTLRSWRPRWPNDTVPLGTLGSVREHLLEQSPQGCHPCCAPHFTPCPMGYLPAAQGIPGALEALEVQRLQGHRVECCPARPSHPWDLHPPCHPAGQHSLRVSSWGALGTPNRAGFQPPACKGLTRRLALK